MGANRSLPHVLEAGARGSSRKVDVRFDLRDGAVADGAGPNGIQWIAPRRLEGALPGGQRVWWGPAATGTFLRLRYEGPQGGLEFVIDPPGREVHATWLEPTSVKSVDDVASLLVGTVLACVLRLRGKTCLHASAVQLGSGTIVLLGERGKGKSTAAAALAARGHAIVSDDIAAITGGHPTQGRAEAEPFIVQPGYPRLRLSSTTIDALHGPSRERPRIMTGMDKRYVELSAAETAESWRFQAQPSPLEAIYVLERCVDLTAPVIEPVSGAHGLATLIRHTSGKFAPIDRAAREEELGRLGRLAATVPVRRLRCPEGLERLSLLCEAIEKDVARGRSVLDVDS